MLNRIIRFSIHNKAAVGLLTLLLVIWGAWSATQLPVDALPDITNNQVQIITNCPTLAAQEVEQLVTFPIEQRIANLPQLEETRSISRFGLSVITVVFAEEMDLYLARQLLGEKLQEAARDIPPGTGTPELAPLSTGLGEVYQYILRPKKGSEAKYSATELRTLQDWIVARQLAGTRGVAEINSFGGRVKQYEVAIDPARLRAAGVSIPEVFAALEANNQNTGGAYISKGPNAYFIRGVGLATTLEDVGNIPVQTAGKVPVLVKDIAEVRLGSAIRYGALTYNGEAEVAGGVVMMRKGENSNEVVKAVKARMESIQKSLPAEVVIEPYLDRTDLVGRAISTVEKNLLEGALIVVFVLVLFLGNLRAGLIVASAIPLSLLFALGLMRVSGVSANLMSLGAIDFGLIVDGAVIIVEATLHHLSKRTARRLTQGEMDEEVFQSAAQIRSSAAFGEIIILIVYIPILTLTGIEGKMFGPMAKTVSFAILGALLLSLTYIPMMCALFLSKKVSSKETFSDRMLGLLQHRYQPLLQQALRAKKALITATLALFALSVWGFSRMGGEFIPALQEGDFAFHCILPAGASLEQSVETSMQAMRIIKRFPEVKTVVGKTGSPEVPTDPMPPEMTDMIVVLQPPSAWESGWSYTELGDYISRALEVIPGIFFEYNQPIQMRFNELMTGVRQDVAVKIFGEDLDSLSLYANKVAHVVARIPGAAEPQVERIAGLPQINIAYDRLRMATYGLRISEVNQIVSTAFAGGKAGSIYEGERRFDLVVRLDTAQRNSIEDVRNLLVPLPAGSQIPLSQLADIAFKTGPAQISREAGRRRIVVGFNVRNRDVESVVTDIQAALTKNVKLPVGYYYTYGGTFENLKKASGRLQIAVPVSLALIFMLLYFTFGSFRQAALIFTAIPMSAIGGVALLGLRGLPFSISAGIGFIALFGVAVLNGIVLIGTFNQLEKEGWTDPFARVIEGAKIRLRPVLMTATVASLGFLPMALSNSAGAEVQRPLATVVIGGLVSATFLTLFVLPGLYLLFGRRKSRIKPVATIVVPLILSLFVFPAQAQTRVLTVEAAVQEALQNNGLVQARMLEVQAAQQLRRTAGELPRLELGTQIGQYNSIYTDLSGSVQQTLPAPGIFKARRKLLDAQLAGRQLQRTATEWEIRTAVQQAAAQIAYLESSRQRLLSLDSLYGEAVRVSQVRYNAGDVAQVEIATAQAKQGEIHLLLLGAEADAEVSYNTLKTLLHTDAPFVLAVDTPFRPLLLLQLPEENGCCSKSGHSCIVPNSPCYCASK